MELRYRWHSRDAIPAQLRQLIPLGGVDVYEPVHVADAETVNGIWRMALPLGSKTGGSH